ncbi:hypothetical protein GLYMA_20G066725v4 [Glycine max]|nr:hypothetical protein GLYMA_20G066725v4 [Glycine max]KAH1034887.1 hypothetical protein GYH30_055036 [Glycine max]
MFFSGQNLWMCLLHRSVTSLTLMFIFRASRNVGNACNLKAYVI